MFGRLNFWPIIRGHWKGLTDSNYKADWPGRSVLIIPVAVGIGFYAFDWKLSAPTAIISGVALLAGGMLSAFTHLSSLRLRLTESRAESGDLDGYANERDMLDESAAHLLAGSLFCLLDAAVLIIGMNFTPAGRALTGMWGAGAAFLSSYVLLLFIITLPRLYFAYVDLNKVNSRLSGFAK